MLNCSQQPDGTFILTIITGSVQSFGTYSSRRI
jgi:hypothetical protein